MSTTTVSFNDEEQSLFNEIKEAGLTVRNFGQFVKEAFRDKLEQVRASRADLGQKTIASLTEDIVKNETKKANQKKLS